MSYLITFLFAALLAVLLTPLTIFLAGRWGIIDYPGERRVHTTPIPRLGGAAIYFSFWLALLVNVSWNTMVIGLFIGSTLIFIIGLIDDIKGMRPLYKLLGQLISVIILIFYGLSIEQVTIPLIGTINLGFMGVIFAVIWIVGLVNTVNISDGLDGLAAGICFIAALILFWSANRISQVTASYVMLALAGSAFGFLFYNYHPARVFMGDSGSMFLGYIIGAVSIWGLLKTATVLGLVFPLLVLGMPITDMVFAIIRRSWRGLSIAMADRGHLHHRLLDAGFSQRQAVFLLYGISFCFGLAAVFCVYGNWFAAVVLVILNMALIVRIMFRRISLFRLRRKEFSNKR